MPAPVFDSYYLSFLEWRTRICETSFHFRESCPEFSNFVKNFSASISRRLSPTTYEMRCGIKTFLSIKSSTKRAESHWEISSSILTSGLLILMLKLVVLIDRSYITLHWSENADFRDIKFKDMQSNLRTLFTGHVSSKWDLKIEVIVGRWSRNGGGR